MPTYEYKCAKCSHAFEQFQSMKDKPLRKCPKCGKSSLERLIGTGAAVIFKGSGFYQTDYRSEAYKKSADADKAPAAPAAGDAKSDSKASDTKPSESKPAESKPAADKPSPAKADAKPKKHAKKR